MDNNDNVIDISDRDKLMKRMVEKDAVKFVQVGTSGTNHCLTLTKNALMALREGKSFPVELIAGDQKVRFVVMRDTTFKVKQQEFAKINTAAKDSADATIEANEEISKLGSDIGNKIITE